MIEILIATHADPAKGVVSSAELIMGPQEHITTVGLYAEDGFDTFNQKVMDAVASIKNEDGVLALVDLFGGTPCNVTAANINRPIDGEVPKCECISGVNLPMLIEALSMRECMSLSELKEHCMSSAADGIKDIKAEFNFGN